MLTGLCQCQIQQHAFGQMVFDWMTLGVMEKTSRKTRHLTRAAYSLFLLSALVAISFPIAMW